MENINDINDPQLPPIKIETEPQLPLLPPQPPVQPESPTVSPINNIDSEKPKSGIKKLVKYLFSIYSISAVIFASGFLVPLGGFGWFSSASGLVLLIILIINIFITKKFININFYDDENTKLNKILILKFILVSILTYQIVYLISGTVGLLNIKNSSIYINDFLSYPFYFLIIPLSLFSLQKEYFNRKTIYFCISLPFVYCLLYLLVGIILTRDYSLISFIPIFFSTLFAIPILIGLPPVVLVFYLLKLKEEKGKGKKTSILILIISIIIFSILMIGLNYFVKSIVSDKSSTIKINSQNSNKTEESLLYRDARLLNNSAELLNSFYRFYASNNRYPWQTDKDSNKSQFTEINTVKWMDDIFSKNELPTSFKNKLTISEEKYYLYAKDENIFVCFKPSSIERKNKAKERCVSDVEIKGSVVCSSNQEQICLP